MFYNVENFYDCVDDPLTNDDEFTPSGERRWTPGRLHDKADRLSKVFITAGKWNAPVFIGVCEVENLQVLELLTKNAPLNKFGYKIIQKDSPDERGIDVAFLYRSEFFKPFDFQAIPVIDPVDKSFRTRDILLVSGVLNSRDTIHVFVNHWPSRYGGVMETVKYRKLAAMKLKEAISVLYSRFHEANIICMGDFNDEPTDVSVQTVLGAKTPDSSGVSGELVNLSAAWLSNAIQTLKNQYTWQTFDQWIVSDYFLHKKSGFRFLKAEILDSDFLLEADSKYGGVKPKRTYVGFKYQDGFSDHLPILLRIQSSNQ